jgi:heat shock protein HslJ
MNRYTIPALLLSLVLLSCSSQPTTGTVESPIIGTWILIGNTIHGADGGFDLSECSITVDENGKITGGDPCNELFGTYTVTSSTIRMKVGGTKVLCSGVEFREYLNDATTYSFGTEQFRTTLRLETATGVLTFRRA